MWELVAEPAFAGQLGSGAALAWALGPALGNLLIFGGLARLGTIAGGRGTALRTITAAFLAAILWRGIAAELTGASPVVALVPLEPRWLPGLVVVGLVALHPSMRLLTQPRKR